MSLSVQPSGEVYVDGARAIRVAKYAPGFEADGSDYGLTYVASCNECDGWGQVDDRCVDVTCSTCNGTGEREVTDHSCGRDDFERLERWASDVLWHAAAGDHGSAMVVMDAVVMRRVAA